MSTIRAIVRLAWRNINYDRRRSLLTILILSLGVGVGSVAPTVSRTIDSFNWEAGKEWFGPYGHVVTISGTVIGDGLEPPAAGSIQNLSTEMQRAISTVEAALPTDYVAHLDYYVPTDRWPVLYRSIQPHDRVEEFLQLEDGRWPERDGEVVVASLTTFGRLELGTVIDLPHGESATVVGIVDTFNYEIGDRNYYLLHSIPDSIVNSSAERQMRFATNELPDDLPPSAMFGVGEVSTNSFSSNDPYLRGDYLQVTAIVAAFGVLLAAILGAASTGTGFHRRLRQFGILAGAGASPVHLRRVLLVESTILATAGAAIGFGLGGLATTVNANWFWVPTESAAAAGVGLLAAVITSGRPLQMLEQTSAIQALGGRIPPPPVNRVRERVGLGLGLGAVFAAVVAAAVNQEDEVIVTVASMVLFVTVSAMAIFFIPLLARLGELMPRLPTSARVIARDVARHQGRTAAGILMLTYPAAVGILTALYTRLDEFPEAVWYTSSGLLLFGTIVLAVITHVGAVEKQEDLQTMQRVGADPSLGRRFAGGSALLIGSLATTWGAIFSLGAIAVWRNYPMTPLEDLNWWLAATLVIAFPILASAIIGVSTRTTSLARAPRTQ